MNIQKRLSDSQVEDFKNNIDLIKSSPELSESCGFAIELIENAINSRVAGLWTDGYESSGAYTKR
ncbi:hypothetical protein WCT94_15970 [Pectobacterium sp. 1950-15]|uniref:hypothetical protein n=1 Tax=Pectobacterium sp. 1950-15 TaxID=3128982 RepID=UPI003019B127